MPKKKTETETAPAKAEPKAQRKRTYEELEKAAGELGARVIWALKFCKSKGGGMVMLNKQEKQPDGTIRIVGVGRDGGIETQWWQDYFMDALDMVGYRVDRKAFYAERDKRSRRKR